MRIRHKLIISLTISITLVAFIFAFFQVRSQKNALRSDLEKRAGILAESLVDNVEPLLGSHSWDQLQQLLDRFENREALDGVAVFDKNGNKIAIASALESQLNIAPSAVHQAIFRQGSQPVLQLERRADGSLCPAHSWKRGSGRSAGPLPQCQL